MPANPDRVPVANFFPSKTIITVLGGICAIRQSDGFSIQPFVSFGMAIAKVEIGRGYMKGGRGIQKLGIRKIFGSGAVTCTPQEPSFSPRISAPSTQINLSLGRVMAVRLRHYRQCHHLYLHHYRYVAPEKMFKSKGDYTRHSRAIGNACPRDNEPYPHSCSIESANL